MLLKAKGNIFDYDHQVYAQGISNQGVMGRGIALEFKKIYPQLFHEYRSLCRDKTLKPGDVFFYEGDLLLPKVFNLVSRDNLFRAEKDYLRSSIENMYVMAKEKGINDIAMPKIGCGLGGLKIYDLEELLQPFINDSSSDVTIYSMKHSGN